MSEFANFSSPPGRVLGGFREWKPAGALGASCEAVWLYEAGDAPVDHRLLPDGKPSLVIRIRRDSGYDATDSQLIVSGGLSHATWYRPRAHECQIGLRLFPEAALLAGFFNPRDYADGCARAPLALTRQLDRIVNEAPSMPLAVTADRMIKSLAHRLVEQRDSLERFTAGSIRRSAGRVPICRLAEQAGTSERQLRRRFINTMGLSPKRYSRVLRYLRAVLMAEDLLHPDWAGIAADCGYSDQSHLIRDTKALTSISPAALWSERRAESEMSNTPLASAAI
jgi:AraC-like DNA-binding protein